MSVSTIFARPLPSTVRSSSGLMRGVRSTEIQPVASSETRSTGRSLHGMRMRRVYRAGLIRAPRLCDNHRAVADSRLTLDDVRAAAQRLAGRIDRTPVLSSAAFDEASGCQVFFKCENLQRAGSFKIRGALNKLLSLTAAERARGVVAYSSGNHAQGVALAARMVGTTAIICMPTDAPALKVEATRGYGAEIVFYDRLKDEQALDAIVTPVGGGGLMAGCSTVARGLSPGITVVGVEADTANDTYLSLKKGERVTIPPPPTIADGIRPQSPGEL